MPGFRLKFSWSLLWMLAAAGLCTLEVCATNVRVHSAAPAYERPAPFEFHQRLAERHSITIGRVSGSISEDTVLVLGNLGAATDSELEVTLRTIPISPGESGPPQPAIGHSARRVSMPGTEIVPPPLPAAAKSTPQPPAPERVYFLPSAIQSAHGEVAHEAISCRLMAINERAVIYVDQRTPRDRVLLELVAAINAAATSTMIENVERLVGPVADLDRDGHLTIVVTPAVGQLGQQGNPVYGITRPGDFVHGVDRPHSNNSDVIFLSSALPIGSSLDAVLCHEWCHASVFSRRLEKTDATMDGREDDDWLNEAIAHIVEVASSGSDSNVANRVQAYLAQPSKSPLVIRDYCCPAYWRNHGVRGAGYLFLDWYLKQSGDDRLLRLVDSHPLDVTGIEAIAQQNFDELFRSWTRSSGAQLAREIREWRANDDKSPQLAHHRWKLESGQGQTLTLRIGRTCADFVHIECPSEGSWRIVATSTSPRQLQTTLIPVSDP